MGDIEKARECAESGFKKDNQGNRVKGDLVNSILIIVLEVLEAYHSEEEEPGSDPPGIPGKTVGEYVMVPKGKETEWVIKWMKDHPMEEELVTCDCSECRSEEPSIGEPVTEAHLNTLSSEELSSVTPPTEEPEQGVTTTNATEAKTKYVKVVNLCDKCKELIEPATPEIKDKRGLDEILIKVCNGNEMFIADILKTAKREIHGLLDFTSGANPMSPYGYGYRAAMEKFCKALNLEDTP